MIADTIEILAFLGSSAATRGAGGLELGSLLQSAGLEDELGAALISGDRERLESILGVRPNICCLVHAPEEEEAPPDGEPPGGGEGGDEEEEGDDSQEADLGEG